MKKMPGLRRPTTRMVVLTGGPCGGKSTILDTFRDDPRVILVPEMATYLLGHGFPAYDGTIEWLIKFQRAVFDTQIETEDKAIDQSYREGQNFIICDRGIIDGAAYLPGGISEFATMFKVRPHKLARRYDHIIHLTSLAVTQPWRYSELKQSNPHRREDVEEAAALDRKTWEVWNTTANPRRIDGSLEQRVDRVSRAIGYLT